MIQWQAISEGEFRLIVPKRLRRAKLGPLFNGRIKHNDPETELVVLFDSVISESEINDLRKASLKPPPFTQWNGLTWKYFIWGTSKTRPGGFEAKVTQTAPNQRGRAHAWSITFPISDRWVKLDITNGSGGLEWNEFEEIGKKIVEGVSLVQ